jgi:putative DNA primase/helicase
MLVINPPRVIAQQYLARVGLWNLPRLAGIITTPTIRPDGTILDTKGYDAATALLLVNPPTMPPIPKHPTRADAVVALALLDGLLDEFKFSDDASRAVALSGMITPLVRGAVPVAPLHASSAPTYSSGKSYLWDVCAALSIGARCPVIAAGRNEEEMEKRLAAILMTGQPIISIDNVSDALGGDFLAQAISQPRVQSRILGKSEAPEIESRTTIYGTGNNFRVRADLVRRTLRATIDTEEERPELHEYKGNPFKAILAERGRYLAAALTVVRAYIDAGSPDLPSPLNGFDEWSAMVRGPLLWLGRADPIETIEESRIDDPEAEQLRAVITAWCGIAKDMERFTAAQMIGKGGDMIEVVQTLPGLASDPVKLSNWLKDKKGRIVDDIAIRGEYDKGKKVWRWHWHDTKSL